MFLWCNLLNKHPEKNFKKMTKKLLKNLIMMELSFLYMKKIFTKLKKKIYALMYLVMKTN